MKHIFIINPAAGTGESEKKILPSILHYCKIHGDDFEIHRSLNKQEVGNYVSTRAAVGDPVRFYAIGGDGTICDVLNGMAGYGNAELAVMPCGSGNDFVKNFTHKENFLDLEKQLAGSIEYVDVIKFNDSYCINMLNIGTDCDIAEYSEVLRSKKNLKGSASYAAAAIELLPKGTTYDLEFTDENGELQRGNFMLVAVGNGKYCGGGFKACPSASLTDGLMDIGLVKLCKGPKLVQMLIKYRRGTHSKDRKFDEIGKTFKVSEFTIIPHQNVNICVDGEISPLVETHCKLIPRAIKIVVPKGSKLID